ncbi:MAG: hypothetical protein IJT89_00035, partial [Bacteroidaceae bacterium]|nr:hypothetical protein [Bacteroidaceae bacterium]
AARYGYGSPHSPLASKGITPVHPPARSHGSHNTGTRLQAHITHPKRRYITPKGACTVAFHFPSPMQHLSPQKHLHTQNVCTTFVQNLPTTNNNMKGKHQYH